MYIREIIEIKEHLDRLKSSGNIIEWELPYEQLLTRRSAAIFFLTPKDSDGVKKLCEEFVVYKDFAMERNVEKRLSKLEYKIRFMADKNV